KYRRKERPVTENRANGQKQCDTSAKRRIGNLAQRADKQETEKQGEHHIQIGILQSASLCHGKAERDLRQQGKQQKPERISFSGMGIAPSFHEEIAHGDGGKISDIHKQFIKKGSRLHKDSGNVI